MEVNHQTKKVPIGYQLFECKRGQSLNSVMTWAKRWRVTESTVRRFFKMLETDKMILIESVKKTTRITVCNYDNYNDQRRDGEGQEKDKRRAREGQEETNKNGKKEKNGKNGKEVLLPDAPAGNSIKNDDAELYWTKFISTWFSFNEKKFGEKPSFKGPDPRHLKKIIGLLKSRAGRKGIDWNEENAIGRFSQFLERAHTDSWLSKNFLLSNLEKQFDKIVMDQINDHKVRAENPAPVKINHGKSSGAVELIAKLKSNLLNIERSEVGN